MIPGKLYLVNNILTDLHFFNYCLHITALVVASPPSAMLSYAFIAEGGDATFFTVVRSYGME
jgi:hypothetical protein